MTLQLANEKTPREVRGVAENYRCPETSQRRPTDGVAMALDGVERRWTAVGRRGAGWYKVHGIW
jgi:hypothetical protein